MCQHFFEAIAKKKGLSLSWVPGTVVRIWKHGCGHTGQRTRETTERRRDMLMVVHFCQDSAWSSAVPEAQSDAPLQVGHRRCRRRSWRHVNQLRLKVVRLAWARRLRRLTLLPRPMPRIFGSGLGLEVLGEELIAGVECRGLRHGIAEFDVTAFAQLTPGFCRKGPRWRATIRPLTVAAMPCSSPRRRTSRR